MPRRTILSDAELASLLALPDTKAELICRYTLSDADLSITAQHRGPANRLGSLYSSATSAIRASCSVPMTCRRQYCCGWWQRS